jgi:hypothetical protein
MKIRNGFVSNSSSSSFILQKKDLTKFQICAIKYHQEFGKLLGMDNCDEECDRWTLIGVKNKNSKIIHLQTSMTNFNMREFLNKIGVPDDKVPVEEEW